jgi:hypothetical protein
LQGQAALEVVTGPVVCGPVGFRKVPLQSRWGEYVRVTVAAPSALRGNVLVHAGGVAQEAREWSTDGAGAVVVEARFPNESVERSFALERERPIDITLTGLEALGGGTCEGAVFTVEHGALVPSIDERAWVAELERRGGPELAARREAARLEADARRQAHYAAWEARQQVVVSAELVAQASLLREEHYAQWDARHAVTNLPLPLGGEGRGEGMTASLGAEGSVSESSTSTVVGNIGGSASSSSVAGSIGGVSSTSTCAAGGTCAVAGLVGGAMSTSGVVGGTCAGSGVVGSSSPCAGGTCAPVAAGGVDGSTTCGGSVSSPSPSPVATPVVASAPSEWNQPSDASLRVNAEVAWAQPPEAQLRAGAVVDSSSQPTEAQLRAGAAVETTWAQPSEAQLRAGAAVETTWTQPFQPHLEPVAVTTESRVATAAPQAPAPSCAGGCEPTVVAVDPALSVIVPAMFQLMFNVASVGSSPQAHAAQPVDPR